MGEDLFYRIEFAQCDTANTRWVFAGEFVVDEGVVLPVVAYEEPFDVGEHDEQVPQLRFLVFLPGAEEAGWGGAPVGEEHGADGEFVFLDEVEERGVGVPGAG